ncbi:PTS system beta-glucoside-specific EIIBCA component [Clostridiales bacterium CHKCI001]|nr:PTS system beta-glucoside-specific EIIBCA component [Clostridiales bacterium CHKCI001]
MDIKKLAEDCVRLVGGKENVKSVIHCATRLRFQLKDMKKAQITQIEQLPDVMAVKEVGAQTQIIIGPNVSQVHKEVMNIIGDLKEDVSEVSEEKQKLSARILDMVSGIFAPIIPLITGAGMIKAILTILVVLGLPDESQEYYILNFIADSAFYFFPVVLGFSSAKKFGCNPYLAAMIGGVLIHPNWAALVSAEEAVSFFGIPVKLFSYSSSVLPIILTVWFMSYVERFADKCSPNIVKAILKPLITLAVTSLVALTVLAPMGGYVGSVLAKGIAFLDTNVPVLVPTIVGGIQPFLVFFGMHLAIFPPLQTIQLADMGYEIVTGPGFLAANIAIAGAAIGVAVRSKQKSVKELAFSSGFTALCGITEPAIYGTIVKFKRSIPAVVIGGVSGGLFAGIFHLKRYAIATPGIPALPTFIGEDPNNIIIACGTVIVAFVVSFLAAYIIVGKDKTAVTVGEQSGIEIESDTVYSPVVGNVIPLEKIPDPTFAGGVLGKGVGVEPSENKVYAPFNGSVIMTADTKHAIGLRSEDGIELIIHVGIDTVDMNGNGFDLKCKVGDTIRYGQTLMTFDMEEIKKAGHPATTAVLVTNSTDYAEVSAVKIGQVTVSDKILIVKS